MTNIAEIEDIRSLVIGDIESVEAKLLTMPQVDCPVTHRFSPGLYIRELFMPAGTVAIGHHQNLAHYNVMLKGKVVMLNTDGTTTELTAPRAFTAEPGRKIGYVLEDVVWQNIYPTHETDIEKLELTYITKSDSWKNDAALKFNIASLEREADRIDYQLMLIDLGVSHELVTIQSENESDQVYMQMDALKIKLDDSPIQGKGLFATSFICKDEIISPARIDGLRTQAGRYTNHSANPNSIMFKDEQGNMWLRAIRDIEGCKGGQNGDEITIDYRQAVAENRRLICQQ